VAEVGQPRGRVVRGWVGIGWFALQPVAHEPLKRRPDPMVESQHGREVLVAAHDDGVTRGEKREGVAAAAGALDGDVEGGGAGREGEVLRPERVLHVLELRHVHVAVRVERAVLPATRGRRAGRDTWCARGAPARHALAGADLARCALGARRIRSPSV